MSRSPRKWTSGKCWEISEGEISLKQKVRVSEIERSREREREREGGANRVLPKETQRMKMMND